MDSPAAVHLYPRHPQATAASGSNQYYAPYYGQGSWVWYAVKWAILAAVFVFLVLLFVGGYMHARRRMKKNLPLLTYHRWLVPRSKRMIYEAQRNGRPMPGGYGAQGGTVYPLHNYSAPPPAYNPEHDYVPPYAPPEGSSKIDPDQSRHAQVQQQEAGVTAEQSFTAPAGPPPGRLGRLDEVDLGVGPSHATRIVNPSSK